MGAQERITAILRGSQARRVNFEYRGARVYGSGYEKIAQLIDSGRLHIRLETNQQRAQAMYALGIGRYVHPTNTFYIPSMEFPGAHPFDSALVIHEMTHALMDWQRLSVSELVSEAAAYTAQMMWLQIHIVQGHGTLSDAARIAALGQVTIPQARAVFEKAWAIAQGVYTSQGGYTVRTGRKTRELENAILAISIYHNAHQHTVTYDGY